MADRSLRKHERKVAIRRLCESDFEAVLEIQKEVFPNIPPWTREQFVSQIRTFPAGQFGIEIDGRLVGSTASLIVKGDVAMTAHNYKEITGQGSISTHDEKGDYLYGIDIGILREYQGLKFARRLYEARKEIVRRRNLRGMIIGGRIPGYHEYAATMSAEDYVAAVKTKKIKDPVLYAQLANEFKILRVVNGYLPDDRESAGYAVLMEWSNPDYSPKSSSDDPKTQVRLCVVQYQMRTISRFEDFARQCEYFVDTASDYRCDFVLFPELITTQLLPLTRAKRPEMAARQLDRYTGNYLDLFTDLAIRYNINIIGGTHLTTENNRVYNVAYLFRRDGTIGKQYKLHITPSEAKWWGVSPGNTLEVFDTDSGRIAIMICYDVEFPELARLAVEKGAQILFVPYNTDMRSAHLRVRTCAQARCIENHCYVAMSGATGNLPNVEAADIHYAQSCILTPSDIPFARDGIADECTPNVEMVVIHDLDLELLGQSKVGGSVHNWLDRRRDLYQIHFKNGDEKIEV
ncbi:MAG: putative amidohydrolase/ribosomal protein S18 acetylase RimI-like enzyme [Alphaproteobacteria bacterium]|jgi:predicted amidohydrolase/ribosomal protein S18 acetylase RimI-like enzyme